MRILGIDASHRNTGVVIVDTIPGSQTVQSILFAKTFRTTKARGVLKEYDNLKELIDKINQAKQYYAAFISVCEIAHSGVNFGSARNVGITWAISMMTNSTPYLEKQVRTMFPGDGYAKDRALAWCLKNNFHLIKELQKMDDHQVDALCVAIHHHLTKY